MTPAVSPSDPSDREVIRYRQAAGEPAAAFDAQGAVTRRQPLCWEGRE